MENLVMESLFKSVYKGKRIFLTGHTGFKGSWLAFWLHQLGAEVMGYSKDLPSEPNHFSLLHLPMQSVTGDICDREKLLRSIVDFQPDIIFHLAAQALVRYSYSHPVETFEANVLGTVNVFEAARQCASVKAVVNVTSDKAYENLEQDIAYKETDRMGGFDPYSASKGCAELIVNSYRNSFFNRAKYGTEHNVLLASARAGNVIGGGDWAEDRLIPDIVRASVQQKPVQIRFPKATRPWQHVLEPLSGYLLLGQLLLEKNINVADGWNFGPAENETLRVEQVLEKIKQVWSSFDYQLEQVPDQLHEAKLLRLDCTKAQHDLQWSPVWSMDLAIEKTASWYRSYYEEQLIRTKTDLTGFVNDAKTKQIIWAC